METANKVLIGLFVGALLVALGSGIHGCKSPEDSSKKQSQSKGK